MTEKIKGVDILAAKEKIDLSIATMKVHCKDAGKFYTEPVIKQYQPDIERAKEEFNNLCKDFIKQTLLDDDEFKGVIRGIIHQIIDKKTDY